MFSWLVTGVDLRTLYVDVPWPATGIESSNSSDVPWLDTGIESGISRADMPWLDTGIESTIGCLQICPGWIQVSNTEIVVNRYSLAGYRNRIWNLSFTDMPWLDTGIESGTCKRLVEIAFLAGYKCKPLT